jgi:hypothetical protein
MNKELRTTDGQENELCNVGVGRKLSQSLEAPSPLSGRASVRSVNKVGHAEPEGHQD